MYKLVDPLSYLSAKEKVLFVVLAIVSAISFFTMFIPSYVLVRVVSAVLYFVTNSWGVIMLLKVQAYVTKGELNRVYGAYSHAIDSDEDYEDEDEDEEDYENDDDEDYENDDPEDEDYDEEDEEEELNDEEEVE